jgi:hypothetical protein
LKAEDPDQHYFGNLHPKQHHIRRKSRFRTRYQNTLERQTGSRIPHSSEETSRYHPWAAVHISPAKHKKIPYTVIAVVDSVPADDVIHKKIPVPYTVLIMLASLLLFLKFSLLLVFFNVPYIYQRSSVCHIPVIVAEHAAKAH